MDKSKRKALSRNQYNLSLRPQGASSQQQGPSASATEHVSPTTPVGDAPEARFTDLPTEVLIRIANHLDLRSVCSLRQANSHFYDAVDVYLQERFSVLYLHPTRSSMKRLLDICSSSLYVNHINHLCILGEPMWDDITRAMPIYRGRVRGIDNEEYNRIREDDWWKSGGQRFKSWPHTYGPFESKRLSPTPMPSLDVGSSDKRKVLTGKQKLPSSAEILPKDQDPSFETCYGLLIDALAKLKNLRTLSYMTTAKYPGLNITTPEQVQSHILATIAENVNRDPDGLVLRRRSDAHVLYRLIAHDKLHFEEINLRVELPFFEGVESIMPAWYWALDSMNPFAIAFRQLTRLDLSIDCDWNQTRSKSMYRHLIRGSATKLQWLRIRLVYNPANIWRRVEQVNYFLKEGERPKHIEMPCLQHFELIFVENHDVEEISRDNGRWRRPPCVDLYHDGFWKPYLKTLTTLRFHHILNIDQLKEEGAHQAMRDNLQFLKYHPHKLETFDWVVPGYDHHPQCRSRPDDPTPLATGDCTRIKCQVYIDSPEQRTTWMDLTVLARDLGVAYDCKTETWNFGDYVRPSIEARKAKETEEGYS